MQSSAARRRPADVPRRRGCPVPRDSRPSPRPPRDPFPLVSPSTPDRSPCSSRRPSWPAPVASCSPLVLHPRRRRAGLVVETTCPASGPSSLVPADALDDRPSRPDFAFLAIASSRMTSVAAAASLCATPDRFELVFMLPSLRPAAHQTRTWLAERLRCDDDDPDQTSAACSVPLRGECLVSYGPLLAVDVDGACLPGPALIIAGDLLRASPGPSKRDKERQDWPRSSDGERPNVWQILRLSCAKPAKSLHNSSYATSRATALA